MIYEIRYKGKVLERLATKSVADQIARLYRKGEIYTMDKPIDVEEFVQQRASQSAAAVAHVRSIRDDADARDRRPPEPQAASPGVQRWWRLNNRRIQSKYRKCLDI